VGQYGSIKGGYKKMDDAKKIEVKRRTKKAKPTEAKKLQKDVNLLLNRLAKSAALNRAKAEQIVRQRQQIDNLMAENAIYKTANSGIKQEAAQVKQSNALTIQAIEREAKAKIQKLKWGLAWSIFANLVLIIVIILLIKY
jgi:cobalamin biosynthesis Mg chelatase CobN